MTKVRPFVHCAVVAALLLSAADVLVGCHKAKDDSMPASSDSSPTTTPLAYPGASASARPSASAPPNEAHQPNQPCPAEMVFISAEKPYCIDRWEAVIEDKKTGKRLSPYYSPDPKYAKRLRDRWQSKRLKVGGPNARATPLPPLEPWQLSTDVVPMAVSRPGEIPHGYLSGKVAQQVCENAGKRLCSRPEWVKACRGAQDQQFPYGDEYQQGTCNVFRSTHPGAVLHDDVTTGHLDPRLNLVKDKQGPLLRRTGQTGSCASRWGNDAIYDMVGNLDEWIEDDDGVFVGGFFSRAKKDGCQSVVKNHPRYYWDYSLGVRCCRTVTTE